jgi:hypothetical protein
MSISGKPEIEAASRRTRVRKKYAKAGFLALRDGLFEASSG